MTDEIVDEHISAKSGDYTGELRDGCIILLWNGERIERVPLADAEDAGKVYLALAATGERT